MRLFNLLGICALICPVLLFGQSTDLRSSVIRPLLVETNCLDLQEAVNVSKELQKSGIHISVIAGKRALLGWVEGPMPDLSDINGISTVFDDLDQIPTERRSDEDSRIAFSYFEKILNGEIEARTEEAAGKMDWGHIQQSHALERDEDDLFKNGGSALPDWSCSNGNNSEVMQGCILASTFFSESDGTIDPDQYTWTQAAIDDVKLQIIDAWSIWAYTASLHGHTITAVMNWYDNTDTIANTSYEPIYHSSGQDHLWINESMNDLGYTSNSKFSNLDAFNYDQRQAIGADHSLCCFMIYNPTGDGAPSSMTDGKIGYAYLGGPYTQMLYRANGWSTSQVYRVYGHEIGHIFHAFDEYSSSSSSNCTRKFNGVVNSNYQGAPCNGPQSCVMINNSHSGSGATRQWNLCAHTPDHLGWEFLLPEPVLVEPLFNEVLTTLPVHLEWDRDTVISGTYGYLKIWDRSNDSLILCQYSNTDTVELDLVNGDYKWRVSAAGGYAGVISDTSYFTVNAPLNASFSHAPTTVCAGSDVQYSDMSTGAPVYWEWHFDGGVPIVHIGADPPSVVYSAPGTYDVRLIVNDDGGGTDTLTVTDAVTVTGGRPLPIEEGFETFFPPQYWTLCCGGQGQPDGGVWDTLTTGTPGFGPSTYFDNYNDPYGYAWSYLATPELDLINGDSALLIFDVAYAFAGADSADALTVDVHDCDYSLYSTVYWKEGDSLSTNGGVLVSDSLWYPRTINDWRTDTIDLTGFLGNVLEVQFTNQGSGGQALFLDNVNLKTRKDWQIDLKVFLEGPYDDGTGSMDDALRVAGDLPLSEPYTALGYGFVDGGGESIDPSVLSVSGNDAIVDWIVLELRDKEDPAIVVRSRAALLKRNGHIVDLDGASPVIFEDVWTDFYYVAVRHRDHLGIMFAFPLSVDVSTSIDMTQGTPPVWGTGGARKDINGTRVMWAGDVNFDGVIKYTGPENDRDLILQNIGGTVPTATNTGYFGEDVNMSGVVKYTGIENDRDIILQNVGGTIPTAVRQEQIP